MVRSVEMIRLRVQITEYAADNCQPIFATMARIALNARLLIAGKLEGIGWFTHECYQRMIAAHPEHQFQLFFDRTPSKEFCYGENAEEICLFPPARRPFLYDAWFDYAVTRQLSRWEADVFLSPDGMLSRRTEVPQIPVFHDLNFMHHPEWMPSREARYYRSRFPEFAKIAASILTVSDHSRQDIAAQFQVPTEQIHVVSNAPAQEYRVLDSAAIRQRPAQRIHRRKAIFSFCGQFASTQEHIGIAGFVSRLSFVGGTSGVADCWCVDVDG